MAMIDERAKAKNIVGRAIDEMAEFCGNAVLARDFLLSELERPRKLASHGMIRRLRASRKGR